MYFTNRIEIGKTMQNNRMNYVHEFLNDHEEVKNTKAHEEMVKLGLINKPLKEGDRDPWTE